MFSHRGKASESGLIKESWNNHGERKKQREGCLQPGQNRPFQTSRDFCKNRQVKCVRSQLGKSVIDRWQRHHVREFFIVDGPA